MAPSEKKGREILLSHYKTCEQEKAESKGNEAASKIGVVSSRRSGVSGGVVNGASAYASASSRSVRRCGEEEERVQTAGVDRVERQIRVVALYEMSEMK